MQPDNPELKEYEGIMKNKMNECLNKAQDNIFRNKLDNALLWTIKGLSFYPNHPQCLVLRSAIYKRLGNYTQALMDLEEAMKFMNIDGKFWFFLKIERFEKFCE